MDNVLLALWLFLPAGIANAVPVLGARIPYLKQWKTPMDFGKKYRGKPVFGPNKTWRGLCLGVLAAILTALLQFLAYKLLGPSNDLLRSVERLLYTGDNFLLFSVLIGLGAVLGDAAASFFKRRAGIKPGQSWFPFDQADFILGAIILGALVMRFTFQSYLIIFSVWFLAHLITVYLGYKLGIRKSPI